VSSTQGGVGQGLLNEDGMLEVDRGAFSIEPFLYIGEELVTWADASPTPELEQGFLPIPSSIWRKDGIILRVTAFATGKASEAVLYVRYRLENRESELRRVRFFAAFRPFQVTPPWQAYRELGGVSRIATLEYEGGVVSVNGRKVVVPLTAPSGFGGAAFERGAVTDYLRTGDLPPEEAVSDRFGCASGALRYDLETFPRSRHGTSIWRRASGRRAPRSPFRPETSSREDCSRPRFASGARSWGASTSVFPHPPEPSPTPSGPRWRTSWSIATGPRSSQVRAVTRDRGSGTA